MASLWENREIPILKALVNYDSEGYRPDLDDLCQFLRDDDEAWEPHRAPAFSRFVMIRPVQSARPRSGEHCFCAGQGAAGPSTSTRTYVS